MGKGSTHLVIREVCEAVKNLSDVIVWPQQDELAGHVDSFFRKSGFPGVVGVIDSTHIAIPIPEDSKTAYANSQGTFSIQLQAVCDSNLKFLDIHAGWPGSVRKAQGFTTCPLHDILEGEFLPQQYHLLGPSSYELAPYMMVPFTDNGLLTPQQEAFNRIHSSARTVITQAFGLLKGRFRRLKYLHMRMINEIPTFISAACILHNYVLTKEELDPADLEEIELENVPENPDPPVVPPVSQATQAAHEKRNQLASSINWQATFAQY